jgi:flagella basal body P-ring formation protein FlgA
MHWIFGSFVGLWAGVVSAEPPTELPATIRIQGRADAIVTDSMVRLGDVAQVDSANVLDDEAVGQLKKIVIGASPRTGESAVIDGSQVLERLRGNGVKLSGLRYSLPSAMTVTRAFREVKLDELERALSLFLSKSSREVDVKQIVVDRPIRVPTDSFGLEVVALKAMQPGHIGIDYKSVAGSDEVRFQLRAVAEEWRLMPVAARPLIKGTVVGAGDVQLQRTNNAALGRDALENIGDIIGRSLTRDVGHGEVFRAHSVAVPPLVSTGSRVSIVFRYNRLEVSASGIALENGGKGQEIKIRNDTSKRIVSGRVEAPGIVMVGAQ